MLGQKSTEKKKVLATELPELLTLEEATKVLKVHPNTLRQWDKKGILIALRFGARKDRKYRKEDIIKFLHSEA